MFFSAVIFGFLAAALALVLELILINPTELLGSTAFTWDIKSLAILLIIAIIEEAGKYLFLTRYLARYTTTTIRETLLVGAFFGLGFAMLELVLASFATDLPHSQAGLFGIAFLHIVTSCVLVSLMQRVKRPSPNNIVIPLGIATGIHWLYNSLIYFFGT